VPEELDVYPFETPVQQDEETTDDEGGAEAYDREIGVLGRADLLFSNQPHNPLQENSSIEK
jgi:hypothetical protein